MPTYSLLIPHKNHPDLLRRCLMSVPRRPDLEVIVCDDHSDPWLAPDKATADLLAPATLTVLRAKGQGAGAARNQLIEAANGDYLLFADADDAFTQQIDDLLDRHATDTADLVFFGAESDMTATGAPDRAAFTNHCIDTFATDPGRGENQLRYCHGQPWCKLIRRHLLLPDGPRLDTQVSIHEDTRFCYRLGLAARSVAVDDARAYLVIDRPGSLGAGDSDEQRLDRVRVFARKERELTEAGVHLTDADEYWNDYHYIQAIDLLCSGRPQLWRQARDIIRGEGITDARFWRKAPKTPLLKAPIKLLLRALGLELRKARPRH